MVYFFGVRQNVTQRGGYPRRVYEKGALGGLITVALILGIVTNSARVTVSVFAA
jgi:hypothetical protein